MALPKVWILSEKQNIVLYFLTKVCMGGLIIDMENRE